MIDHGTPGSATYAVLLDGLDAMLTVLPDNTANQISASDTRDVVFTLYSQIGTQSEYTYYNANPSSISVGGIASNTTFDPAWTLDKMFTEMFYPYTVPTVTFGGGTTFDFRGPLSATPSVSLSWSVVKTKNDVTYVHVERQNDTPTDYQIYLTDGSPQSPGDNITTGSISGTPTKNVATTFTLYVKDYDGSTGTDNPGIDYTTSVSWSNRYYWGTHPTKTLPNNAQILALDGASVGSGNVFASSRVKNFNGINGAGKYLVFAFPTSFGTPSFLINNLPNTAFTKIGSNISFTNTYGYTGANYDVWITDTAQNSLITLFQIN